MISGNRQTPERSRAGRFGSNGSRRTALSAVSFVLALVFSASLLCTAALAELTEPAWDIGGRRVETPTTVSTKGTFKITHSLPAILGKGSITAECASSGEDAIGAGGAGEVKKRVFSGCKVVASTNPNCTTATAIEISAIDLPWHTSLAVSEGAVRDYLTADGKGEPGIEYKCGVAKGSGAGDTSTAIKVVAGDVNETFDSHSEEFTVWKEGGTGGKLEGTQLLENPTTGTLSVEAGGEWLQVGKPLTGSKEVSSSGAVRFFMSISSLWGGGFAQVECNESGKGTVGAGGAAEVTSMSLTGCEVIAHGSTACPLHEPVSVRAYGLPWHSSLITREGATREYGSRHYEIKCRELVTFGEGTTSTALKTLSEGVNQEFDTKSESLGWSSAVNSVLLEGAELLQLPGLEYRAGI